MQGSLPLLLLWWVVEGLQNRCCRYVQDTVQLLNSVALNCAGLTFRSSSMKLLLETAATQISLVSIYLGMLFWPISENCGKYRFIALFPHLVFNHASTLQRLHALPPQGTGRRI